MSNKDKESTLLRDINDYLEDISDGDFEIEDSQVELPIVNEFPAGRSEQIAEIRLGNKKRKICLENKMRQNKTYNNSPKFMPRPDIYLTGFRPRAHRRLTRSRKRLMILKKRDRKKKRKAAQERRELRDPESSLSNSIPATSSCNEQKLTSEGTLCPRHKAIQNILNIIRRKNADPEPWSQERLMKEIAALNSGTSTNTIPAMMPNKEEKSITPYLEGIIVNSIPALVPDNEISTQHTKGTSVNTILATMPDNEEKSTPTHTEGTLIDNVPSKMIDKDQKSISLHDTPNYQDTSDSDFKTEDSQVESPVEPTSTSGRRAQITKQTLRDKKRKRLHTRAAKQIMLNKRRIMLTIRRKQLEKCKKAASLQIRKQDSSEKKSSIDTDTTDETFAKDRVFAFMILLFIFCIIFILALNLAN